MLDSLANLTDLGLAAADALSTWDTPRRVAFRDALYQRSAAARAILYLTASMLCEGAVERHFISEKHRRRLPSTWVGGDLLVLCGRTRESLEVPARERASAMLRLLPSAHAALEVLKPEIGAMLVEAARHLRQAKDDADARRLRDIHDVPLREPLPDEVHVVSAFWFSVVLVGAAFRAEQVAAEQVERGRELDAQTFKGLAMSARVLSEIAKVWGDDDVELRRLPAQVTP